MDLEAVVLVDLRMREEPVQELVPGVAGRVEVAVAGPGHRRVRRVPGHAGPERRSAQPQQPSGVHGAHAATVSAGPGDTGPGAAASRSARCLIPRSCYQCITMSPCWRRWCRASCARTAADIAPACA